ncbi:hypothetical protein EDB29_1011146 [Vibrio crassostreae]|uniref:hypothetical protein n=1 Tax=Vibrio crassostreae TaxID=246167 RepID=UPI001052A67E|nr:hypothetical protein [Vibrio crassostreae]CAH6849870.1 conserved hypothetical protein [Vibrio chagasii]TCT44334.1 hypothetical protein EDB29_1011146 [Vibrio crassostreae]CAH6861234.1 conserved hypothetical protein [Vibrio chagasii]CAH6923931.1 conserved hypothetical protein [Vibrio chagasii]CAH6942823.1 conserved hypothetical protein [Vibrio chagasii]
MKLSQIKIDRRLCGAFICYLKRNGYICTNNKNKQQPYFISHSETPELTHIIELDQHNNWIIPEQLKQAVFEFSTVSGKHSCIETCTKCKEPYHIVDHEFICPKCKEPHVPF